eukprot:CAMPEP_0178949636 /NCGR_PEP_ID=MMETSP0789-20121207/6170_1 /TAXON_ID=3005 /ORGANISM="Rhizosolenia setigera, Strain CCMP 1694" /LENGTH=230 /DNA_ID=CAMNT_0020630199 /DNA_START=31 /DNA_END=723 /DNA_ORIENTATION=-
MSESIEEYNAQLAEVNEMLESDPNDESLLQIKADLLQLIAETTSAPAPAPADEGGDPVKINSSVADAKVSGSNAAYDSKNSEASEENNSVSKIDASNSTSTSQATKKSSETKSSKKSSTNKKTMGEFEIPSHLVPLESDTEGERNKKRRAIKALKSKWRLKKKEFEGNQKQKSWQDFASKSKKKKRKGGGGGAAPSNSIFRTEEGVNSRVGVIGSGKSMTEFGERKRFKM